MCRILLWKKRQNRQHRMNCFSFPYIFRANFILMVFLRLLRWLFEYIVAADATNVQIRFTVTSKSQTLIVNFIRIFIISPLFLDNTEWIHVNSFIIRGVFWRDESHILVINYLTNIITILHSLSRHPVFLLLVFLLVVQVVIVEFFYFFRRILVLFN